MSRSHHQSRANLDDDNAFVDLDRSVAARAAAQKFLSEGGGGNMMTSQLFMGNETGGRGGISGGGSGYKPVPRIALNRSLKAHHKLFVTASSERDKHIQSHLEDMAELYADPTDTTTTTTNSTSKKKASFSANTNAGKKRERPAVVTNNDDEDNGKDNAAASDDMAMLVHSLAQCGPAALTITPPTQQLNKKAPNVHDDNDDDIVLEEHISDNLLRFLDGDILLPPYSPTTTPSDGGVVSAVSTIPTSLVGIPLTCTYYSMAAPTLDCIEVPSGPHHPSLAVGCGGGSGTMLGGLRQSVAVNFSGTSSGDGKKSASTAADSKVVVSAQFLNRPYVAATTGPGMSATISRPNRSSTSSTPPLLCSVCWLPAPNLCAKCGVARFCCVECADVHDATRCNKFVV